MGISEAAGGPKEPPRTGRPGPAEKTEASATQEADVGNGSQGTGERPGGEGDDPVVFGTLAAVMAALAVSLVSTAVNTVFIERHHGSDRHRNRRKVRKICCFSKDG